MKIEVQSDGLALVDGILWMRAKLRRVMACTVTGRLMDKGELAYRPIGNGTDRYLRIAAAEVEKS